MKPIKTSELRSMTDVELQGQIDQNERSMVDMRFKQALGELENTASFRVIRRDIARMKTTLRQRELNPGGGTK